MESKNTTEIKLSEKKILKNLNLRITSKIRNGLLGDWDGLQEVEVPGPANPVMVLDLGATRVYTKQPATNL